MFSISINKNRFYRIFFFFCRIPTQHPSLPSSVGMSTVKNAGLGLWWESLALYRLLVTSSTHHSCNLDPSIAFDSTFRLRKWIVNSHWIMLLAVWLMELINLYTHTHTHLSSAFSSSPHESISVFRCYTRKQLINASQPQPFFQYTLY